MKAKSKKILSVVLLAGSLLLGYFIWRSLRPIEIVAVHEDGHFSSILVKNFPITDRGKIAWWLENKNRLKSRYGIPKPASYGSYTIIFWDFGEGYKEEGKYDRMCFYDMQTPKNCIDKEKFMTIYKYNDEEPFFSFDGNRYLIGKNGGIVKMKNK
ncbi:DUF943 family protein [Enterobacteriaceae bacterium H18W14]|uniref:DUF943 family protein n=1 Tax=Dryocola boscaweniae TaxID=2925397 RepID=UPI0022F0E5C1|nr:DUF943 family protein [Dryocola boscaweniae]MCT4714914.1 DUF943 family protein [Dryocola boscaweniae]